MGVKDDGFSKLGITKLFEREGVKKSSEESKTLLKNYLEKLSEQVSFTAVKITNKNNKKRVDDDIIELAFQIHNK